MNETTSFGLKEAVDLLNVHTARSDTLWNFYALVAIGVLTLGLDKAEDWHGKIVLSSAFLVFALVNLGALRQTQATSTLLYAGIKGRVEEEERLRPEFRDAHLRLRRATPRQTLAFHAILDLGVLAALWTR